ncbi:MAG: endonuclease/exonuclease/phosphatase family protein [Ferruginibacter sp.]
MRNNILIVLLVIGYALPVYTVAQDVRVMSYNIRLDVPADGENAWGNRKEQVAGLMNFYEADFIGCQEVQHHQLEYLLNKLPDYTFIGVGRDDGKQGGEYSCIFYKAAKYKLLEQGTFWLSPTPSIPSKGWDAAYPRVCTFGLFRDNKTKEKFWVFNTHLDHIGKTARLEGVKLIIDKMMEHNPKNYPVILTGDFNSHPEDAPIVTAAATLQNTREISKQVYGPINTWNGFKFHEKLDGCIDYIFINRKLGFSVSRFSTITDYYDLKYPSDHLPVMADIHFNEKNK